MAVDDATISEDDVLALICAQGADSDVAAIRARLKNWRGVDVDVALLEQRLEQLRCAGLVRRFQPSVSDKARFHLTEIGVQRLQDREHKPAR
jgi:hypothetical protein